PRSGMVMESQDPAATDGVVSENGGGDGSTSGPRTRGAGASCRPHVPHQGGAARPPVPEERVRILHSVSITIKGAPASTKWRARISEAAKRPRRLGQA